MSKNIVRTFGYAEGPYVITFEELEDGSLIESREHVHNYQRRVKKTKREYLCKEPLNRYSKYSEQIRTTDVWSGYDY